MRRRPFKKPRDPSRVGGMVPRVLRELGYDTQSVGLAVARSWDEIVGAEAARHSEPIDLRGDTIDVRVDSPAWSQHLQLRQDEILAALAERIPNTPPSQLRLHVR